MLVAIALRVPEPRRDQRSTCWSVPSVERAPRQLRIVPSAAATTPLARIAIVDKHDRRATHRDPRREECELG